MLCVASPCGSIHCNLPEIEQFDWLGRGLPNPDYGDLVFLSTHTLQVSYYY